MEDKIVHLLIDLREEVTVKALRDKIAVLEQDNAELRERCRMAEYNLMCEYRINEQLIDWLRAQGIKFPRRLIRPPESVQ